MLEAVSSFCFRNKDTFMPICLLHCYILLEFLPSVNPIMDLSIEIIFLVDFNDDT